MIQIDFNNTKIDTKDIEKELNHVSKQKLPAFAEYKPPFDEIEAICKEYMEYKNVIVIGNGGSITTFKGYYNALKGRFTNDKKAFFVDSAEPDKLNAISEEAFVKDSIVIPVSKSGTNTQMTESFLYFFNKGYKILGMTSKDSGALHEIFERNQIEYLEHPPIGGRYSGMTPTAFLPAYICGMDIHKIFDGAKEMYEKCAPSIEVEKNPALKISAICYLLDKKGYDQIFMPIYSSKVEGFITLLMQLLHESSGKNGKGQTLVGVGAPESQHHTNQRFFGGPKNMIGLFVRVKNQDDEKTKVEIKDNIKDIPYRDGTLEALNGVPYAKGHEFEYNGTKTDATNNNIPNMTITLDKADPYNIGEFVALWHYIAVYSSWLRGVDPFNQPEVEAAKNLSFESRKSYTS